MKISGILIDPDDHVVTLVQPADAGDIIEYSRNGIVTQLECAEPVPIYHKAACQDIRQGETVRKYGQPIGIASRDIRKGQWVHIHNLISACFAQEGETK